MANDSENDGELAREAEWRWGNSDAFRESMKRTQSYTPQQWAQLKAEGGKLLEALGDAKRRGVDPNSAEAMAFAELNREYNSKWFYPTDHAMHARLAEMYVADDRFRATYDNVEPGLADWYAAAIQANAKRAGADLSRDSALNDLRATMGLTTAPTEGAGPFREDKAARRERENVQRKRR